MARAKRTRRAVIRSDKMSERKRKEIQETGSMRIAPKPEVLHSPSGMKQVGVSLHIVGLTNPIHFPLGFQWRWFNLPDKSLLQVLDGERVVAEADAGAVTVVYGPAWVTPVQRTPERP